MTEEKGKRGKGRNLDDPPTNEARRAELEGLLPFVEAYYEAAAQLNYTPERAAVEFKKRTGTDLGRASGASVVGQTENIYAFIAFREKQQAERGEVDDA